ncbi:MAG: hypothetical protein OEQ28_16195, partial [Acidobacteriota bacterium]|nr:hypothetical protein [Acidobacteriota bacterium]
DKRARDSNGDSPLSWASWHQRPASILQKLAFGDHYIGASHIESYTADHGRGFGGLELHLLGKPHHGDGE